MLARAIVHIPVEKTRFGLGEALALALSCSWRFLAVSSIFFALLLPGSIVRYFSSERMAAPQSCQNIP